MENLKPYLSYRERVTKEFLVRGLSIPVSLPLERITEYCQEQCDKFCIGENGMYTVSGIQLFGIFCIPIPIGFGDYVKKSLYNQLKKEGV